MHIENIDGGGGCSNTDSVLSPESSKPNSPKLNYKNLQPKNVNAIAKIKKKMKINQLHILSLKNLFILNLIVIRKGPTVSLQKQLQKTLDGLNIGYKKSDKKEVLQQTLFDCYLKLVKYDTPETISKINCLKQRILFEYIKEKREKIYGPGFANKDLCKNREDVFSAEPIEEIPDMFFFSIKDSYGSIFFSIRTFKKLVDKKSNESFQQRTLFRRIN